MQIHIVVHYMTHFPGLGHNKAQSQGNFEVNSFEYEINPIQEVARVAKMFCDKLISQNVNKTNLIKVIYNETNDITNEVRRIYVEGPKKKF